MNYGLNIRFFENALGLARAAEVAAKVGFTHLDYTPPVTEDNWYAQMLEAEKIFAANGLTVHQTHAPFNRYGKYGDTHKLCLDRCAEATAYLGADFLVAHGDEFDFEALTYSPEAALEYNRNYFLPYLERAEKEGYKLAFETVFADWDRPRFTAQADELYALITSFESESAVCCWDFGHSHVSMKKEAPAQIRRFGKLIQCTHLHDNTGRDSHQIVMTGTINWAETMQAFADIGYGGILSLEFSHGSMQGPLAEELIRFSHLAAKELERYL